MLYENLFYWWAIAISWSTVFLVVIGTYLYRRSRKKNNLPANPVRMSKDLAFVWISLGLLTLYLFSIHLGSANPFRSGKHLCRRDSNNLHTEE
jgi:heme/copper-type cytochrome/quinol oxidase subunit 2